MTAPTMELRRPEEAPPTKPGWYYALRKMDRRHHITPIPYVVMRTAEGLAVSFMTTTFYLEPLRMFSWFGPVPVCVPAVFPKET